MTNRQSLISLLGAFGIGQNEEEAMEALEEQEEVVSNPADFRMRHLLESGVAGKYSRSRR